MSAIRSGVIVVLNKRAFRRVAPRNVSYSMLRESGKNGEIRYLVSDLQAMFVMIIDHIVIMDGDE